MADQDVSVLKEQLNQLEGRIRDLEGTLKSVATDNSDDYVTRALAYKVKNMWSKELSSKINDLDGQIKKIWTEVDWLLAEIKRK